MRSVAIAAGLFLALAVGCERPAAPPDSDAAAESNAKIEPAGRVLLIGLDGADWKIIDRLAAEGRLPTIDRLRREGAAGILRSEQPLLSPIVWTTIATGRHPVDHGILGFLTVRDGKTEPVRSDERQVRAFWNVAGEMGLTVGVIGWYASWPAEPVNGFLVTDRVGYHQVESEAADARSGLVHPDSLASEVGELRRAVHDGIGPQAAARFFSSGGTAGAEVAVDTERLDTLVGILRTSELYRALLPNLMQRYEPDLAAVYFEGTDAVGHLFAEYGDPPLPGVDPELARHLGVAFDRYYEYIDTVLGEIVASIDPSSTTLMLVSDHGFKSGAERPRSPTRQAHGDEAPLWHRPEGILLMWGRGVRAGVQLPEASIYDVVPTMFRAIGAPLAENLQGRPVDGAFTDEVLRLPVRSVEDYESGGARDVGDDAELPADEVLSKLRALGYVGGGTSGSGPTSDAATGSEGQSAIPLNRYNAGIVLLSANRRDKAHEVFRSLQTDAPQFILGFLGAARIELRDGRFDDAIATLESAAGAGEGVAEYHSTLGEAYLSAGRKLDGDRSFRRALQLDSTDGRSALRLAELELPRRAFDAAGTLFEIARRYASKPADRAAACVGLAVVEEERRRFDRAAGLYEEALRVQPGLVTALERYGNLELYRGRPERAVELLARLAELRGDNGTVLLLYGRALAFAGRLDEAETILERALRTDSSLPEARQLLEELRSRRE